MESLEHTPSFNDFPLDERCARILHRMRISLPTPVQARTIPSALQGKDLIVTAQTGTGKTLAFSLPALTRLARHKTPHRNRMLVLAPTRELCLQVEGVIDSFCKALRLRSVPVYGGVGMGEQLARLRRGCDIVVATPGRLLDHLSRGAVAFDHLEILVFDEADRMLDMGFLPDIRRILRQLPAARQTLMFSATFAPELERLSASMMRDPERISVGRALTPVAEVRQCVIPVHEQDKTHRLLALLKEEATDSTLVFARTIHRTDRLARLLQKIDPKIVAIHGDLPQAKRQRALEGFRKGTYRVLIATDVAARGLDVDGIAHVINYDIPRNAEDYLHRIGRTARATREGDAITFATPADHTALAAIEETLGYNLERREYEGAPKVLSLYTPPELRAQKTAGTRRRGRSLLRRR